MKGRARRPAFIFPENTQTASGPARAMDGARGGCYQARER
ncbi:hypothetical protein Ga0080574_TMP4780 [Salipiger abyssi]|uniref:Uncharacterized protein n=1 Tax=Salipiger abyssi TaxID=1250539 RepID=A0A1P8V0D1_9RHOB|nr:hypothetical protein Ga0080574_TMP4780 [Salipiger abyssi]